MKFSGTIYDKKEEEIKGFKKHVLVIQTSGGEWPNYLPIEFIGRNIDKPTPFNVGDQVEVETWGEQPTGRKWPKDASKADARYFLSLEGKDVKLIASASPSGEIPF